MSDRQAAIDYWARHVIAHHERRRLDAIFYIDLHFDAVEECLKQLRPELYEKKGTR